MRVLYSLVPFLFLAACGPMPAAYAPAKQHLDDGEYEKADALSERELAKDPDQAPLWTIQIRARIAMGDLEGAVSSYESMRQATGDDAPEALRTMAHRTLEQALGVPAAAVRASAIRAVERAEVEDLAQDVARLMEDTDDLVAASAAAALLRSHPQAPELAARLMSSPNHRARATVVSALGRRIKNPQVRDLAENDLHRALNDNELAVRSAAVGALGAWGRSRDRDRLVAHFAADKTTRIRARVLRALQAKAGQREANLAVGVLLSPYLGLRLAAIDVLREVGGPSLVALEKLRDDPDALVRLKASIALALHQRGSAEKALREALASADWPVRAAALNLAVQAAPKSRALALLRGALADKQEEVRLAAARGLYVHSAPDRPAATRVFVAALKSTSPKIQLDATTELAVRGDARGLRALDTLTRSSREDARIPAILAHLGAKNITPGLVAALADPSAQTRIRAAEVILRLL